jgi:large subunit ribosomal protein L15
MNLNQILGAVECRKNPKRRGRGEGSGLGKSAGRGNKGAKQRSGWRRRYGYEGGQMPLSRRVPKRGFNNFNFATYFDCVNVGEIGSAFPDGSTVDRKALIEKGILKPRQERLKVLGDGDLKVKLTIVADTASASARKKIEAAGGTLNCLMPPRKKKTAPVPPKPAGSAGAKGAGAKGADAKGAEGKAGKKKEGKGAPAEGQAAPPKAEKASKKEKKPNVEAGASPPRSLQGDGKRPGKKGEEK